MSSKKTFKVGDRVTVDNPRESLNGQTGTVTQIDAGPNVVYPIHVEFDDEGTDYFEPVDLKKEKERKAPKGPQTYLGNGKHAWETVNTTVIRLRVPGGWLYRYGANGYSNMAFVQVPEAVGYAV